MNKIILTVIISLFFHMLNGQNSISIEEQIRKINEKRDSTLLSTYGNSYPDFVTITLNGDTITQQHLIGKVTLINCWFEFCAPCVAEIPALNELYLNYNDSSDFQLFSFTFESPEDAERCVQKFNIGYPVCSISQEKIRYLNIKSGFPTNIIIDKQGKIVTIKSGGATIPEKAKEEVLKLEEKIIELLKQ